MAQTAQNLSPVDAIPNRDLIHAGFQDLQHAKRWLGSKELTENGVDLSDLLPSFRAAASPDQALSLLVRLIAGQPDALKLIGTPSLEGLLRLLGSSSALGEFLIRRPAVMGEISFDAPREDIGDRAADLVASIAEAAEDVQGLRVRYRQHLCETALFDLFTREPVDTVRAVSADLADLASAAMEAALRLARTQLKERFGTALDAVALSVQGMGKCGARELNYISDVDVVYVLGRNEAYAGEEVSEELLATMGTALASACAQILHGNAVEPFLWEVDANLRPEGKDGALVRTVDSYSAYYAKWAHNWEFQALLKARHIAGDPALGERFQELTRPLVFSSSQRDGFVEGVRAMRERVTQHIPAAEAGRQIKLGVGGLRDVEFTVQLLQMVHGKTEPKLHVRGTLDSIAALTETGFIGREDGAALSQSYRFLRLLEHRIQLMRLRRTHLMPESEADRHTIARSMGLDSAEELMRTWQETRRRVRELHEKIFFRPLLVTAASLSPGEVALRPEEAQDRLAALGYVDPAAAMRHIESLTQGVSRRVALQRQLLPVLLAWFAEGVSPDAGILAFRKLSEALGTSPWFLRMLRDSNAGAKRLCRVLSSSRLLADWLEFTPEAVQWLGENESLEPRTYDQLWNEVRSKLARTEEADAAARFVRMMRRREIMRIALADSAGLIDSAQVRDALADADAVAVLGMLHLAEREEHAEHGRLIDFSVIALGRQGGQETTYGSDADVLYVYRPAEGTQEQEGHQGQAERIANRLQKLLTAPVKPAIPSELVLKIDAALRPEGRQGVLVRSLDSYAEYYANWAELWEYQALLRARPMAGNDALAADFIAMVDQYRYPNAGISDEDVKTIRRIKARVEGERLPRGADPARHLKLGRGSLSDVEWLVQLFQLRYAGQHEQLRTTSTLPTLEALAELGIIQNSEAQILQQAWTIAAEVRAATVIYNGRSTDVLPAKRDELEAIARWMGRASGSSRILEEDYLRLTRRARIVFEKLFFGY